LRTDESYYITSQCFGFIRSSDIDCAIVFDFPSFFAEASRKIGITEQTYYRWRREYGGLRIEQAKKLKNLEKENTRLKKLVADLSLDNAILKGAAEGNF